MAIFQPPAKRGEVHIWSRKAQKPGRVADCLATDMVIRYHDNGAGKGPFNADYYIVDKLELATEREAVHIHAMPVVLPEATAWLTGQIRKKVNAGTDVTIAVRRQS